MRAKSTPVGDFIKAKGGAAVFAAAIGKKSGAVRMMRCRGVLPRSVWPEIISAYPEISLDDLMALEQLSASTSAAAA
jgi:hypothetical protein